MPLRDNFWLEVTVSNNGNSVLRWADSEHPSNNPAELHKYDSMGETAFMAYKRRQALDFIRSHPGEFLWLCIRRFVFTWTGYWSFQPAYLAENPYDSYNILLVTPLTLLMLTGLLQAFRRRLEGRVLLASILVLYPAVYYFTDADMRYRHQIDPEILMLAVFAVVSLRARAQVPAMDEEHGKLEAVPLEVVQSLEARRR